MTQTLKKQLTLLCAATVLGGALLWNSGALRAQSNSGMRRVLGIKTSRVPLSRDEAARNFAQLLQLADERTPHSRPMSEPDAAVMSSFSLKSEREIGEGLGGFITKMAGQWQQPQFDVQVQNETANSATVVVGTQPQPVTRPFVLIREGDGWGVDVFETYAQWNGITGAAKTAAIANFSVEFERARENARRSSCQSNLKQIALGIAQYTQDYDEKYPLAKPWIDVLQPYVRSEQIFKCPGVTDAAGYGYAYNSKLSTKPFDILSSTPETVSVYETSLLKRNAYGMGENPAFRHQNGANYAFADGHVKWFAKTQIPSFKLKP